MKLMILADLHICNKYDLYTAQKNIANIMTENIEAVIICGDIFESSYKCNPYKKLSLIFRDTPVIAVLGNHEFFYRDANETLEEYKKYYNPDKYNIHYLDIAGHYDIGEYRFFGNVLWYDGSMATLRNQNINDFANKSWMDCTIKNFDWKKENERCVEQIENNKGDIDKVNILCTHCVPHKDLNLHMDNITSPYNAFSGMVNFLEKINPDYSFCGHTHKRIIGKYIGNCKCVNVGNDLFQYEHLIIDV